MSENTIRPVRNIPRSSRSLHGVHVLIGTLGGLAVAFVLVMTGIQLGRTFDAQDAIERAATIGGAPGSLHPCGTNIRCFEKSRYRPVWL
jgi:hypothetical protein